MHGAQGRWRAARLSSSPNVVCLRLKKRGGRDVIRRRLRSADAQVLAETLDSGVAASVCGRSCHGCGGTCGSEKKTQRGLARHAPPDKRRRHPTGACAGPGQARSVVHADDVGDWLGWHGVFARGKRSVGLRCSETRVR